MDKFIFYKEQSNKIYISSRQMVPVSPDPKLWEHSKQFQDMARHAFEGIELNRKKLQAENERIMNDSRAENERIKNDK